MGAWQPRNDVHGREYKSGRDCRGSRADTQRMEWEYFFHDPEPFRECHDTNSGAYHQRNPVL